MSSWKTVSTVVHCITVFIESNSFFNSFHYNNTITICGFGVPFNGPVTWDFLAPDGKRSHDTTASLELIWIHRPFLDSMNLPLNEGSDKRHIIKWRKTKDSFYLSLFIVLNYSFQPIHQFSLPRSISGISSHKLLNFSCPSGISTETFQLLRPWSTWGLPWGRVNTFCWNKLLWCFTCQVL